MARPSISTPKTKTNTTIKFVCSYGGKILPRFHDGKLSYYGGETRVLSFNRSISFFELLVKLEELCGTPVALRCQLPTEDLDTLVSITSDEDLVNLIQEYDRTVSVQSSPILKIRAFLWKKSSPISSPKSPLPRSRMAATNQCGQTMIKPPLKQKLTAGNLLRYACQNSSQSYLVHHGNHWQSQYQQK